MSKPVPSVRNMAKRLAAAEDEIRKLKLKNYGESDGGTAHSPRSFFANAPTGAGDTVVGDNGGGSPSYLRYSNIIHETNPGDYDATNGLFLPGGLDSPVAGEWGFSGVVSGVSQGFPSPLVSEAYENTLTMYVWDFDSDSLVDAQPLDSVWVEGFASSGHGLKDKVNLAFAGTWGFSGTPVGLLFSIGVPLDAFGYIHPSRGSLAGWEIA